MKFVVALLALLGGALVLATPASAHATLVRSSPSDGARLATAPSAVTLRFDEQVGVGSLGYLNVTDQAGRVVSGPATRPAPDLVRAALRAHLGDGTYTASYRVVSADSHPVSGVVRFVVGNGPLVVSPVDAGTSTPAVSDALAVSRWISYGGIALLGGAWLLLTVWPAGRDDRRGRAVVWTGWGAAAAGALLELLWQGPYAAGTSSPFSASLIDATLHTDYGQLHSARLVLLGVIAVVLGIALQPARTLRPLDHAFWPLGLGVAYTFAAAGHATTTRPAWLSIGADMVHLSAMAIWVGGLAVVGIALLPRREPAELRAVLPVFSRVAFIAVVLLAASGAYAAWRGVGSWRALVETSYGWLVLAKIAGFAALLALGNLARRVIRSRVRRPVIAYAMTASLVVEPPPRDLDEIETERMRRSVLVEVVVAALVLALTAVLVAQPRGAEALAASDRAAVHASAPLGGGRFAQVTVDPGRHGVVGVEIAVPGRPQAVQATAYQPSRRIGPVPIKLVASGPGLYSAAGVDLPVTGTWVIALVVTSSRFDAVTTDARVVLS